MWKRNRKLEAEAVEAANFFGSGRWKRTLEAVKRYRFRFQRPFWPFISNVKNLNVVQFFVKYATKRKCFIDYHLQRSIFKRLAVHLDPGQPQPYQLKDEPCG